MTLITTLLDLVSRGWTFLCRPLILLLDALFRPDRATGRIAPWKVIAWVLVNCAALFAVLNMAEARPKAALIAVFLWLHILVILGSLRVMAEEKQVLEGSLKADQMTFSVYSAVNSVSLLAVSIAFYVLGLPALIGLIEDGGIARILSRRPPIPFPYAANLACVLNEMPAVGPVINALANLTNLSPNLNAEIVYTGLAGNIARLLIVATVGFMVVRAIVLSIQQASHRRAILHSVENGHGRWDLIEQRILRLPHGLADRLHRLAEREKDSVIRHRIEATLTRLAHPFRAKVAAK